jgi:hypothetical protein
MKRRFVAGLCAAVLALPAYADVLDFESLAPRGVGFTDVLDYKGYLLKGDSGFDDSLPGDLVGGILDGSKAKDCQWLACPVNNDTHYYGGLNDGVMLLSRADKQAFSLTSLDASYIGAYQGQSKPDVPGFLRIQAFRADQSFELFDIDLHRGVNEYFFEHTDTGDFGKEQFVSMAFFGFSCDFSGDCFAFSTNEGQFGIDNLNLSVSAVPEPSGFAMLGTGMLVMGTIARRRKNNKFKEKP